MIKGDNWLKEFHRSLPDQTIYPIPHYQKDGPLTHGATALVNSLREICVGNLTIIGSDQGFWPVRRQAII